MSSRASHCEQPRSDGGGAPRSLGLFLLLMLGLLCGCNTELNTTYGRHRFPGEPASVNGTDVLAGIFTAAGHDVHYRRTLVTSEMEDADIVVWFPNSTMPPSDEVCDWFDDWLASGSVRTLIYVGRGFDAAPEYYDFLAKHRALGKQKNDPALPSRVEQIESKAKAAVKADLNSEKQNQLDKKSGESPSDTESASKKTANGPAQKSKPKDKTDTNTKSDDSKTDKNDSESESSEPVDQDSLWFKYEPGEFKRVTQLGGPWAKGIDAQKARIELRTRIIPHEKAHPLLTSGSDTIVSSVARPYWDDSEILFVTNGSFLLNLPLVNPEHRKLAAELVRATGTAGNVVFLESGAGGPAIDPPYSDNSLWTLFKAWPLGVILLQLAAVGVLFCFARWPIFGRPKQPPAEAIADFSKHVAAVGELLARTRNREFAVQRVYPVAATQPVTPQTSARSQTQASQSSEPTNLDVPPSLAGEFPSVATEEPGLSRRPPALPPDLKGN